MRKHTDRNEVQAAMMRNKLCVSNLQRMTHFYGPKGCIYIRRLQGISEKKMELKHVCGLGQELEEWTIN